MSGMEVGYLIHAVLFVLIQYVFFPSLLPASRESLATHVLALCSFPCYLFSFVPYFSSTLYRYKHMPVV